MRVLFLAILILFSAFFANAQDDCVRAEPVQILKKSVFPKKTFALTKGTKDNPGKIGYEKVKVNKDIDLTIKNWGCENYSLTFQFLVKNLNRKINDTKFWYAKAIELMNSIKKGIRADDINLINRGLKATLAYKNKTKNLKYETEIDFGGKEIRDVVILDKVKKQGVRYQIEISFSVGPL